MRHKVQYETQSGRLRVTVRVPEQCEAGAQQALKTALLRVRMAFKPQEKEGERR